MDQGIGLNEEDRKKIFEPYFVSSSLENRARNTISNGIGLNICKRIAVSLNGDLYIADQYTKGCKFVLELTLHEVHVAE